MASVSHESGTPTIAKNEGHVDLKTLFSALQNEMNARITARAAINTAHIQVIATFSAGFLAAKAVAGNEKHIQDLAYLLCAVIPMISYYFVSLYMHNDWAIGLLNKCLGLIEHKSQGLGPEVSFYAVGGEYKDTWPARNISNRAVYLLCGVSPFLFLSDAALNAIRSHTDFRLINNGVEAAIFTWSFFLSGVNFTRLLWLQCERQRLVDERREKTSESPAKVPQQAASGTPSA